jgi:hypothetical protein
MAQVRGVTLVDKSPGRVYRTRRRTGGFDRRLEVPYEVIELLVPVRGGRDTVLAVDAVDSGSVAGLAHGVGLPVRLDPAAPREAQLAGGTRRLVEANRYHFLVPVLGCAVLGTLAGLAYRWRRKRQTTARDEVVARQGTAIATGALLLLLGAGSAAAQVSAGMRIPGKYAPQPTTGTFRQLVCRGKAGLHLANERERLQPRPERPAGEFRPSGVADEAGHHVLVAVPGYRPARMHLLQVHRVTRLQW